MKTIMAILVIHLFLISITQAQNDFNDFYKKYKNTPGIVCDAHPVSTDGIENKGNSGDNFWTFYKKFDYTRLIYSETVNPALLQEMKKNLPGKRYKEVGIVDGLIQVKFKETRNTPNELLIISSKPGSLFVMCITGSFSFSEAKTHLNSINSFINSHNIVFAGENE